MFKESCFGEIFWLKTLRIITARKVSVFRVFLVRIFSRLDWLEHFIRKNCKKTNQKEFRVEKAIKKKGKKLYVKWTDCNISVNSWIDKKDIVSMNECFRKPRSLWINVNV